MPVSYVVKQKRKTPRRYVEARKAGLTVKVATAAVQSPWSGWAGKDKLKLTAAFVVRCCLRGRRGDEFTETTLSKHRNRSGELHTTK